MSKYAMICDYKYCTYCHACEVSCRNEKGISLEDWGIKVVELGPQKFNGTDWYWNYVAIPSSLCDMCEDRIAAGQKPACVHHCLAQCLEVVPVEEASAKFAELGGSVAIFTN